MQQLPLAQWMEQPEQLNSETLFQLRRLVDEFPYFQTARLLYLKNLYLLQAPNFNEELRRSVLYIADLSILFYYIEGDRFRVKVHEKAVPQPESTGDRTLDLIEQFLQDSTEGELPILPLEREFIPDYFALVEQEEPSQTDTEEKPMRGQNLIDKFIQKTEPLPPLPVAEETEVATPVPPPEVVKAESEEEDFLTETLAKIYIKQHRYEKALEIIQKLELKYPKKNAYFADQIRFLKKVIINAKTK